MIAMQYSYNSKNYKKKGFAIDRILNVYKQKNPTLSLIMFKIPIINNILL